MRSAALRSARVTRPRRISPRELTLPARPTNRAGHNAEAVQQPSPYLAHSNSSLTTLPSLARVSGSAVGDALRGGAILASGVA